MSFVAPPTQAIVLRDSVCGLLDVDKSSLDDRDRQVSTLFILAAIVGAVILLTVLGLAQVRGASRFLWLSLRLLVVVVVVMMLVSAVLVVVCCCCSY